MAWYEVYEMRLHITRIRVRQRQLATRKEAEKVLAERKAQKMEEALRNRHEIIQHYQNYKPSIAKPEEGDGYK
eukprot:1368595-Amorphochlora_amoeboformis.AAC.1